MFHEGFFGPIWLIPVCIAGVAGYLEFRNFAVPAPMAPCLEYAPAPIVLAGTVRKMAADSPAGYGRDPSPDARETYLFLDLGQPICTVSSAGTKNQAESSIRQLQIIFIDVHYDESLVGREVGIVGTLFHAVNIHHHTKVLISPSRINR
jgi:hypothetical protein